MSKKGISRRTLFGSTALMAGANLLIPSAAAQVVPKQLRAASDEVGF